jgi:hypothetical protein
MLGKPTLIALAFVELETFDNLAISIDHRRALYLAFVIETEEVLWTCRALVPLQVLV